LIFSDDAGYADFGFMDQFTGQTTKFKTPNLDSLAQQSVVFSNGYVSAPLCSFSRAGLLTGRNSSRFGVEWNFADTTAAIDGIPTDQVLISERLKQLGYTTGVVGKWHVGASGPQQPLNQGFDEFFGVLAGTQYYFNGPNSAPTYRQTADQPVAWWNEPSFNNIPNDPLNGRLFTDALGDEASKFIANHAGDENPFFLYLPFNAPHAPLNKSKASDAAPFYGLGMTVDRHVTASLTYGMDRNIGEILKRIDDPNGDGDQSDSIRNNTIVVFVNDNGGHSGPQGTPIINDNGPLKGYKGSSYEGGVRVPFMIRAPGVAPGVVNDMVSSLDLFPTFVAAAGGEQTTQTDGVDLMPMLRGETIGPVHEKLFWRMRVDGFAVRKGNWKLAKGNSNALVELYYLNPDGSGEDLDLSAVFPDKLQELTREFVHWESEQDKIRNTGYQDFFQLNQFDVFRQRNDLSTVFNWRWAGGWKNANDPGAPGVTMQRWDAAPNTVLIFETRNDASYTSLNNVIRAVGHGYNNPQPTPEGLYEFMLNEVRLDGNFNGAANRSGTLHGNPIMFVDSLTDRQARLSLNANQAASSRDFTFNINMDVILLDDLLVTGNGTGSFTVGGVIRDFDLPRGLIKEGASKLTLNGYNTYNGDTIIRGGELSLSAAGAAIDGSAGIYVQNGGALRVSDGLIATSQLQIDAGGVFEFTGGTLKTGTVAGDLVNAGGAFELNGEQGVVSLVGNYSQNIGALKVDVAYSFFEGLQGDRLDAAGAVQLGGSLDIAFTDPAYFTVGDSFTIISAASGLTGQFTTINSPTMPPGLGWAVQYTLNSATLKVVNLPGSGGPLDFFSRWRQAFGTSAEGDWDGDGDSDGEDFLSWQRSGLISSAGSSTGVPEPSGCLLAAVASLLGVAHRRRALHSECSCRELAVRIP